MKNNHKKLSSKTRRYRKHRNIHRNTRISNIKRGGLLIMNPETDLVNSHLCNTKAGTDKDKPGLEIFNATATADQLNVAYLPYFLNKYKNTDNNWFKFVIFNNSNTFYIYFIKGAKVNKHPVCLLEGLLDVTKYTDEYVELRNAVNNLLLFKNTYGGNMSSMTEEIKNRCYALIEEVNQNVDKDIRCMPIVASGSGSVNADNSICLNNKSGHYKPTQASMQLAKEIFEKVLENKVPIHIKEKEDKNVLLAKYGENAEHFSGICLP